MMSQRNKASGSSQTDSSFADIPGYKLPDTSAPLITVHHTRQTVPPRGPATQGKYDQDVHVCITCHARWPNNAALCEHGKGEDHYPYGCVCGNTFSRLDVLERHIASKNKAARFPCPLCEHDETPRAFSRADHLPQHLRTFHKIADGRIPQQFGASVSHHDPAQNSRDPQPMPRFPCLIPGCTRTGELAYLRQIDLDEHIVYVHRAPPQINVSIQQGPSHPLPTWTNNGFQQSVPLQTVPVFGQDAYQNDILQLGPSGVFEAEGDLLAGNMGFQPHDSFNMGFSFNG
ncbi:hypothetical protein F5Y12DRAFT_789893 [Xylaria sp. FL1777]|nr:hypothetical protein F5Y12DRAFT_789893 [Xylaria sp. FL1777]